MGYHHYLEVHKYLTAITNKSYSQMAHFNNENSPGVCTFLPHQFHRKWPDKTPKPNTVYKKCIEDKEWEEALEEMEEKLRKLRE